MSDEKTNADAQKSKAAGESHKAEAMPFQKMMAEMMVHCGCRPEQMGAMWAACCGAPSEKKENDN